MGKTNPWVIAGVIFLVILLLILLVGGLSSCGGSEGYGRVSHAHAGPVSYAAAPIAYDMSGYDQSQHPHPHPHPHPPGPDCLCDDDGCPDLYDCHCKIGYQRHEPFPLYDCC